VVSAEVQNDYRARPVYNILALDVLLPDTKAKPERYVLAGSAENRFEMQPLKL